jgi:hypothetical protein
MFLVILILVKIFFGRIALFILCDFINLKINSLTTKKLKI